MLLLGLISEAIHLLLPNNDAFHTPPSWWIYAIINDILIVFWRAEFSSNTLYSIPKR
jgi:hypothetical protein